MNAAQVVTLPAADVLVNNYQHMVNVSNASLQNKRAKTVAKDEIKRGQHAKGKAASSSQESSTGTSGGDGQTANLYLLMSIMIGLINVDNQEQIAGAKQAAAESNVLAAMGEKLAALNPKLKDSSHFGATTILVSIVTFGMADIASLVCHRSISWLENDLGDDGPDESGLMRVQNEQQEYGLVGSQANQEIQTDMQIHVTQASQNSSALGSQWSQMLQVWQQESNTSNSR